MGFLVAAVIGGLAAADIVHERPDVTVILALVVGLVAVVFLFHGAFDPDSVPPPPPPPPERPGRPPSGERPGAEAAGPPGQSATRQPPFTSTQPGLAAPPRPGRPERTVGQGTVGQGGGWWANGQGAVRAVPGEPGASAGEPMPNQLTWLPPVLTERPDAREALIAQCPNCGSFQLDGTDRRHEWRLYCHECAHEWTWQKGEPWPPVQVRPEIRGQRR